MQRVNFTNVLMCIILKMEGLNKMGKEDTEGFEITQATPEEIKAKRDEEQKELMEIIEQKYILEKKKEEESDNKIIIFTSGFTCGKHFATSLIHHIKINYEEIDSTFLENKGWLFSSVTYKLKGKRKDVERVEELISNNIQMLIDGNR